MPSSSNSVCCPLSTTFNSTLERSLLSIDWVLTSGLSAVESLISGRLCLPYRSSSDSVLSLDVQLAVSASLPFDLVLGRDWLVHCTNSVPDACFYLSSGLVNLASFAPDPPALCSSTHSPTMDIDGPEPRGMGAEASSSRDTLPSLPQKTSLSILRDIFLGHHATRSRISIFHSDLPTIKTALVLHSIPSHNMSLIECRRALLHHILSGACADYENDADHIAHIRLARQRQQQVQQDLPYLHRTTQSSRQMSEKTGSLIEALSDPDN
ncbi:hypothetical protein B0H10DRAFT_2122915 [Mycena sp. CBHHK59/15]|nr:hypothetical protein B0H10DRAFT_2122915 [Mycena sp. CBHHK59/15]